MTIDPEEIGSTVSALQGASRDIFLTNNLEPRPGRVEVQLIHEIRQDAVKFPKIICSFTRNSIWNVFSLNPSPREDH